MIVKDVIDKIHCKMHLWIITRNGDLKLIANEQVVKEERFADYEVIAIDNQLPVPGIGLLVKKPIRKGVGSNEHN
ncbi:MAG: hypothetical protein ACRCWQ_01665 [Bacilli bacterium]